MELHLPESWANDCKRCRAAKIPDDVLYRPKWQIAHSLVTVRMAVASTLLGGLPRCPPCHRGFDPSSSQRENRVIQT